MKENVDYELIVSEDDEDHWRIRILTGDFTETVFEFTVLTVDPKIDSLRFNYVITYSPLGNAISETDNDLIDVVGDILYDMVNNDYSSEAPNK